MKPKSNKLLINLLVTLFSLIFTFALLEIGTRIFLKEFHLKNFWDVNRDLFHSAYPAEFNRQLGWAPKKGASGSQNVWGTEVTINKQGLRSNGTDTGSDGKANEAPILATGDSFTFGDQVSDQETWPAILEDLTEKKVINGGVFGYGLDQSWLRMKMLARKYQPAIAVLSLIPADILRCELSERTSIPKPYFEIKDDELILQDTHITDKSGKKGFTIRRILGYSLLIHKFMLKAFPELWLQGSMNNKQVHSAGKAVACKIFDEIESWLDVTDSVKKFYLLIQYSEQPPEGHYEMIDEVLNCVNRDKVNVIDLRTPLMELKKKDKQKYHKLFIWHMSPEGNRFVADILSKEILN